MTRYTTPMAIRHGLAGQYGKSEAFKRHRHALRMTLLVCVFGFGAMMFVTGFFWSFAGIWWGFLWAAGILATFLLAIHKLDPYMESLAQERLKFMRGGQAEALVSWLIEHETDDVWHLFNNVKLEQESDHDHIVVGPGGLFLVSTKSHRGWFVGSADGLRHNRDLCPFATDALRQTAKLGQRLKAVMGDGVPWIQAVLCVPFGYTDGDVFNGKVWLCHADDLTDRIAPDKPSRRLSKEQVARAVKAMAMIQADAAAIYERTAMIAKQIGNGPRHAPRL